MSSGLSRIRSLAAVVDGSCPASNTSGDRSILARRALGSRGLIVGSGPRLSSRELSENRAKIWFVTLLLRRSTAKAIAMTHCLRAFRASAAVALLVLGPLSGSKPVRADDAPSDAARGDEIREVTRTSRMETLLAKALSAETKLKAPNHTLAQAVQMLADHHGINIVLSPGVAEAGLLKTQVSLALEGVTLRSALAILLRDVDGHALDFVIDQEMILIELRSEVERRHSLRVYNVKPLLGDGVTADDVARVVTEQILPEGSRKATALGSHVIVSHNKYVHQATFEALNRLMQNSAAGSLEAK